jgi:hypothetical protein
MDVDNLPIGRSLKILSRASIDEIEAPPCPTSPLTLESSASKP